MNIMRPTSSLDNTSANCSCQILWISFVKSILNYGIEKKVSIPNISIKDKLKTLNYDLLVNANL